MWPPSTHRLSPLTPPLLLNSAFQRMCAYSADLNFRLRAWHTEQPRPALPPVAPFGNAQECLLFPRLTQGLRDPQPFLLLSLTVFPYPSNPPQSCARTLSLKVCPALLFFFLFFVFCWGGFRSISCFVASKQVYWHRKCAAPCSSNTWEGAGLFPPKCRSAFSNIGARGWTNSPWRSSTGLTQTPNRQQTAYIRGRAWPVQAKESFSAPGDLRVEKFHMWPLLLTSSCGWFLDSLSIYSSLWRVTAQTVLRPRSPTSADAQEQFGQTQSDVRLGNMTKYMRRGQKCADQFFHTR